MTSPKPLHSCFRTRTLKDSKIGYILADLPTSVNRTYGFMRIPATEASTPHPRVILRLDDSLHSLDGTTIYNPSIQFDKKAVQKLHRATPEHLVIGTPHPIKALALDPQMLKRERQPTLRVSYEPAPFSRPSSILKTSIMSTGSRLSKKRKTVTLIEPKRYYSSTTIASGNSSTSISELETIQPIPVPCRNKNLSFLERRKLFTAAEFTIAKHGRKMSQQMMPIPRHGLWSADSETTKKDLKAMHEINEYIRKHGYVMSNCGVTNVISVTTHSKSTDSPASILAAKTTKK